jgi:hypothetical protein
MRILRSVVIALTVAAFAVPAAEAEEPYVEFLQGLRDRKGFDTSADGAKRRDHQP